MDEIKGIVAPNRSIVTKVGVKAPNEIVTPKIIGKNWQSLINIGWIIVENIDNNKTEEQLKQDSFAKPERIIEKRESEKEPDEIELEKLSKKKTKKKNEPVKPVENEPKNEEFGAKKA